MKTIKLSFVALAILVMGTFVFTGCSEEGSTVTSVDSQVLKSRIIDEGAFLAEFYEGIPWERRRTVVARDSLNAYVVTEIILEGDTRARGYLAKDKAREDLLYFVDVDRRNYVLRTVNFITEEREIIRNINLLPDYGLSHEFDVIEIIDDVVVQPNGWFWGLYNCTEDTENYQIIAPGTISPGHPGDAVCKTTCEVRRFGFIVDYTYNWATCSWVTTPY